MDHDPPGPSAALVPAARASSVAVVGCGVAGPAVAALLARQGWAVTVFERATPLRPVGAGLLIQPTGQHVLARLGVLDRVAALAAPVRRLEGVTTSRRLVLDLAYADLAPDMHGLGITRRALFDSLLAALRGSGATLVEGREIKALRRLEAGTILVDGDDHEHGPYDVVLLCDGARSALRPAWSTSRPYAYGALWCLLRDPAGVFGDVLSQVYGDTRTMVGFLPSGRPSNGAEPTVSMFWSLPMGSLEVFRGAGLVEWKSRLAILEPRVATLLPQIVSMDQLIPAHYHDIATTPAADGSVAWLGDSAHAMSPQLGQGANLALCDAALLADLLGPPGPVAAIPAALMRFSRERRRHIAFYRRASRWLTPWFQSDQWWLAPLRDAFGAPLSRLPFVRRQMLLALAGVKTGLVTSLPLPRR